jgi:tRNA G26 N,N-dimethylase Trm1
VKPSGFALTTRISGARQKMANQLGKVYMCGKCGSQVIVTKGGTGTIKCCGGAMEQKK